MKQTKSRVCHIVEIQHEGKITLGRPGHRWEDDIEVDLGICSERIVWIYVAQNKDQWWALVSTVMNLHVS
jgi:hypothetical protein